MCSVDAPPSKSTCTVAVLDRALLYQEQRSGPASDGDGRGFGIVEILIAPFEETLCRCHPDQVQTLIRLLDPTFLHSLQVSSKTRRWLLNPSPFTFCHHYYRHAARVFGYREQEILPMSILEVVKARWPDGGEGSMLQRLDPCPTLPYASELASPQILQSSRDPPWRGTRGGEPGRRHWHDLPRL